MEDYYVIGGQKHELRPEQVEQLKKSVAKSPFNRNMGNTYYIFNNRLQLIGVTDDYSRIDDAYYKCGNYCTDPSIMGQHIFHMRLNNLLWRYSVMHNGDKIDWKDTNKRKFTIYYNYASGKFDVECVWACKGAEVYFIDKETAESAITEVVIPYLAGNPFFAWSKM